MPLSIVLQLSLSGNECYGFASGAGSDQRIWRLKSDMPQSERARVRYIQALGIPFITGQPLLETGYAFRHLQAVEGYRIADQPGWNGDSFALADGRVFCPIDDHPPTIAFAENPFSKQRGSLDGWRVNVASAILEHPMLLTTLGIGFAAPLRAIASHRDEFAFELCGNTQSDVDLAAMLLRSLTDKPDRGAAGAYVRTFADLSGSRKEMHLASDVTTIVDDLCLHRELLRAEQYRQTISNLITQVRTNAAIALITRTPLAESVPGSEALQRTLEEELITLPFPAVPMPDVTVSKSGSSNPEETAAAPLRESVHLHYGHALPAFLNHLVNERRSNAEGLHETIDKLVRTFVRNAAVDVEDRSSLVIARKFGLIFAGLHLAMKFGVFPSTSKGKLGQSVLTTYAAAVAAKPSREDFISVLERIAASPETFTIPRAEIANARARIPFVDSYLVTRSNRRELLIQSEAIEHLIPNWSYWSGSAECAKYWRREPGRRAIQRVLGNGIKVRVICFALPLVPRG